MTRLLIPLILIAIFAVTATAQKNTCTANIPVHGYAVAEPMGIAYPVPFARVTITDASGNVALRTNTNAFGRFTVEGLPCGSFFVHVAYKEFRFAESPRPITDSPTGVMMFYAMLPEWLVTRREK